ncbi:hypothetical protein [Roseateles sp.]|uniref:hypothetical protein n=1 Tax=Roseateles sp. TaxID=1971397 RepID=UPI0039E9DC4E
MKSWIASTDRCLGAMARMQNELGARLDDLATTVRKADAAQARRELWAWCVFAAVAVSGLVVVVALVATLD